ncbi:MAG: hypothetical protein ACE5FN_07175 [Leptospirillia bacterium]
MLVTVLLTGVLYVGMGLSPSSYGYVLKGLGAQEDGVMMGTPREIRADEFSIWTSLIKASVNNHFARYNATSVYGEDLRTFFSMPLNDWGMVFKPTFWGFPLAPPWLAFSFHYFAIIALFIVGYQRLFRMLGGSDVTSFLAALVLFFTGYVQYWWTVVGPLIALFPWILLVLDLKLRWGWRLLLFYWTATCWLLMFFYPPLFVQLAFVAALVIFGFRREWLAPRRLAGLVTASAAACGTAVFYLRDYLGAAWHTHYPGLRSVGGGGEGLYRITSHFLPTSQIFTAKHQSLQATNICSIATVGSFYLLFLLCFLNWKGVRKALTESGRPGLILLGAGVLMTNAWLFLPIPSWMGALLLWDRVPPYRMVYASGLLLLMMGYVLAVRAGLRLTWPRFGAFTALTLAGWGVYKVSRATHFGPVELMVATWHDWLVVLPLAALVYAARRFEWSDNRTHIGVLAGAALLGGLTFGTFNPLQDSHVIFSERPVTPFTRYLDQLQNEGGGVLIAGMARSNGITPIFGATLNGLGYRAVNHTLTTPRLDIWRVAYPHLPEKDLDEIFNRFAHIVPRDDVSEVAALAQDYVVVPADSLAGMDWGRFSPPH